MLLDDSADEEAEADVDAEDDPEGLQGVYDGHVGADYVSLVISVEQLEADGQCTETPLGDMPTWVWWPIGVAGVFPAMTYLIWRVYNAKKVARSRGRDGGAAHSDNLILVYVLDVMHGDVDGGARDNAERTCTTRRRRWRRRASCRAWQRATSRSARVC